jgi:SAM-dependent methyltransferase
MKKLGENLIFLISLPRSGSTLLQHILSSHSAVAATAEPWILFPSACALHPQALTADYNGNIGQIALREFLSQLGDGEEQYYAGVRKMALYLYNAFMVEYNKKRFLDKTSRYYLILPELFRIFPRAHYIFLLRNPIAVFASFLESMVFGDWSRLGEPGIRNDLLDGYKLVREGIRYFGDDAIVLKYEDLVANPETSVRQLCKQIGMSYEPDMVHYGKDGILPGRLIDPKSIHMHDRPVQDYVDAWKSKLTAAHERYFARSFLSHLGPELLEDLGYSYRDLMTFLCDSFQSWKPFVSWDVVMTEPRRRSWFENVTIRLTCTCEREGIPAVIKLFGRALFRLTFGAMDRAFKAAWIKVRGLPPMYRFRQCMWKMRSRLKLDLQSGGEHVSSEYRLVSKAELSTEHLAGWRSTLVAEQQGSVYQGLLKRMYDGEVRQDFKVAALALRLSGLVSPTILEIGCGNGHYSEVLSHLARQSIDYTGVDYSQAMIESARRNYPDRKFMIGDATALPFSDRSFDLAWSGTVLMHIVEYQKAIEETCRVARRFCIFHSTPLLGGRETTFLCKKAYGMPVSEVIINQAEFERLLREHGLTIRHILESLPYCAGNVVDGVVNTLTYVCEKRR